MSENVETVTTKNGLQLCVNDDAQIVVKVAPLRHKFGYVTMEPIVLSRADSLRIAQEIAEKRAAEHPAKEPSTP